MTPSLLAINQSINNQSDYISCFRKFSSFGSVAWALERQSAWMSKNSKGGLHQYGPKCFSRLIFATIRKCVRLKGLNQLRMQQS